MHETDYLKLDAKLLLIFITVYETGSVSQTAIKLGHNQSSISHALDRLRSITHDHLFVRSGRSITPTERAAELFPRAQEILKNMHDFTATQAYDPSIDNRSFTILANDYEIQIVLANVVLNLRQHAPGINLQVKHAPSQFKLVDTLRDEKTDLALCPSLPNLGGDMKQQTLFEDIDICYYDSNVRDAPNTLNKYCKAPHAMIVLGAVRSSEIDVALKAVNKTRHVALECPNFTSVATFVRGTDLIATMPSKLSSTSFSGLANCIPPIALGKFGIAQIWHARNEQSPRHQWLRNLVANSMETTPSD